MIRVLGPLAPLLVEQQKCTEWWIVRGQSGTGGADFFVDVEVEHLGVKIIVRVTLPQGWRYNRASIPDIAEIIVSKDDCGTKAPGPHDAFYGADGVLMDAPPQVNRDGQQQADPLPWCTPWHRFTRAEADEVFYQIMRLDEVVPWKAKVARWAVRNLGRRWQ
jgi:hypothetical protein